MPSVNVGTIDRALRIALGVTLIGLMFAGTIGYWGLVGLVPLLTGVFARCPAYSLFGMSTCARK